MSTNKYVRALSDPLRTLRILNRRHFQIGIRNNDPQIKILNSWPYGVMPKISLAECFPNIMDISYEIIRGFDRTENMSITVLELNVLLAIEKYISAKRVLEIGTYDGGTTVNLAANLEPGGIVTTIDLPPGNSSLKLKISAAHDNSSDPDLVGTQFRGGKFESRIHQIFGDSADLDFAALDGPYDLVFIDGCHDYEYVKSDSEKSLSVLNPDGVIVWHDYSMIPDVAEYVDELAARLPVRVIQGTRLALYSARWRKLA